MGDVVSAPFIYLNVTGFVIDIERTLVLTSYFLPPQPLNLSFGRAEVGSSSWE